MSGYSGPGGIGAYMSQPGQSFYGEGGIGNIGGGFGGMPDFANIGRMLPNLMREFQTLGLGWGIPGVTLGTPGAFNPGTYKSGIAGLGQVPGPTYGGGGRIP